MPAIVALVASNFARDQRPRAYGLVASAGAIAVAAGPLIGRLLTTYASWRWVFAGEVLVVLIILALTRRIADTPAEEGARLDLVGTVLSALGLGLVVHGILRSGSGGLVQPKAGAPVWLRLSPVIWLVLTGAVVLRVFLWWENHRVARGGAALVDPAMPRNLILRDGLRAFFFQYLLQVGLFFAVPLFLSVALGLSAVATGVRLLRCPSPCCWPPWAFPNSARTHPRATWSRSGSARCSPAWCSWWPRSTWVPGPRS
jgi:MFS family permease